MGKWPLFKKSLSPGSWVLLPDSPQADTPEGPWPLPPLPRGVRVPLTQLFAGVTVARGQPHVPAGLDWMPAAQGVRRRVTG